MFGSSILILVPHPDDEVVACAAAIGRAQKEGAKIFALYLTHGCIAKEALWPWQRRSYEQTVSRRRAEAKKAAALLGITPAGFSDRPARHLRLAMEDAAQDIAKAIGEHKIDQLWIPAYEGGNVDHDALNGLCAVLWPEEKRKKFKTGNEIVDVFQPPEARAHHLASILEFAEYNFKDSKTNANAFPFPNGTETVLALTKEERALKQEALALYASEQKNLGYVGTGRETFRPLASYDYANPPHKGTLWYARFHWVPFRHPRIDFTKPEEVCVAISSFAKASGLPESAKR